MPTPCACALQVDKLNAELLSERVRHEGNVQELRERHEREMNITRQGYQEEMAKLQREMDQLKEGSAKVRCSMYHSSLVPRPLHHFQCYMQKHVTLKHVNREWPGQGIVNRDG